MNASEARAMDDATLRRRIQESRQEMFNMRFQLAVGKPVNTSRFRLLRRDIARMNTVLGERQEEQVSE